MKPYVLADLQRDPEFNLIEMLATGLVLGGVTVSAFPVTVDERKQITAQLEDVLTQFSLYRINTPMTLAKRISAEEHERLLEYFKSNKTIATADIKQLQTLYTPARYLLFVNIDSDKVTRRRVRQPNSIEFRSIRTVVITLNIISMLTEKPALYTKIALNNVNTNNVQLMSGRGGGDAIFGSLMAQVTFGGFPEPPTITDTLYKVFLAVADQVPNS